MKHLSYELSRTWNVYALVPAGTTTTLPWIDTVFTYDQWSLPFLTDLNPSFIRNLRQALSETDPDIVHTSKGVWMSALLSRLVSPSTKVVYAAQNVEADHARDFASDDLPIHKKILGPRLIPFLERLSVRCADHVTTVSEKDADTFRELYGLGRDSITPIPTGTRSVDHTELDPQEIVRERFDLGTNPIAVFHGTGTHPPNREAARLICETVAPAAAVRGGDVHFVIAGKGMPDCGHPLVSTLGFVEDLDSLLHAADIAVVPIRHGGGTKTKIYDYLSHGLPMVTSKKGVEGIDVKSGTHAIVLDDVDERFVDEVATLATNPDRRMLMQESILSFASARDWSTSAELLKTVYTCLR
ncbi:glycosyltransferase family 4 protein [Salinigranum halophilum]|uniref:glycosyltransferase family 4 protein n=1 Tax=Salinigranum halophilum TaxID=2565931 RepID=UPI001375A35F|nr:glycosyltransferase family 4 protein [Salinigranum halophilum]